MKNLYIIRHAKSSWSFDLSDHDRPLGKRGRRDVIKMGKHLIQHQKPPEIILSSTASRAFYTSLFLCDQLDMSEDQIQLSKNLFHAGNMEIISVIQNAPDCNVLAICGHNPGLTSIANILTNGHIENIPTCGIVGVSFEIDQWKEVKEGSGSQRFFYYPKGV